MNDKLVINVKINLDLSLWSAIKLRIVGKEIREEIIRIMKEVNNENSRPL